MNSYLVYRASFYLMMTVATTALCADPTEDQAGWFLPPLVAAAGVVAFLTVDRKPEWALPSSLATLLAIGSVGLLYIEYSLDDSQLIRCLGHWLVSLQLIKYFLPKSNEDDWFLFMVGLMQTLIGAVINMGDQVGVWLFLWGVLAVWVLGQFFLQREARRFLAPSTVRGPIAAMPNDPYRSLFDWAYFSATARVLVLTLGLGFFIFLLVPRQQGAARTRFGPTSTKHLTGFDEEVALGQLGEILENDTPVLSVEFSDALRAPVPPPPDPHWRGVTLNSYENGRWRRDIPRQMKTFPGYRERTAGERQVLRQSVKLEPNDSPTLFGVRPFIEVTTRGRLQPTLNILDGTISRAESRGPYDYEVISDVDPSASQSGEEAPSKEWVESTLLHLQNDIRKVLEPIAQSIIEKQPTESTLEAVEARARALEAYLLDPRIFAYTLEMSSVDPTLDPVVDFLLNRKEGHCEYFASSLALLLRSVGIPSRLVNGFKGGDWNDFTQSMTVRQKHAHSWVEAYLGRDGLGRPIWLTLDPTPGNERDRSIAQVGGLAANFRGVTDLFRYIWVFYILGYDSNRQNKLYSPLKLLGEKIVVGYGILWKSASELVAGLFQFRNLQSLISVKGFVVSFLVLCVLAALTRGAIWLVKFLIRWWRGPSDEGLGATAGILFYHRLTQLLADYDLKRAPAETQGEFAHRAFRFLSARGDGGEDVAVLPERVVEAFYQVRFGERELSAETLEQLERSLDVLESRLSEPVAR